jgi:hypothetical protein
MCILRIKSKLLFDIVYHYVYADLDRWLDLTDKENPEFVYTL